MRNPLPQLIVDCDCYYVGGLALEFGATGRAFKLGRCIACRRNESFRFSTVWAYVNCSVLELRDRANIASPQLGRKKSKGHNLYLAQFSSINIEDLEQGRLLRLLRGENGGLLGRCCAKNKQSSYTNDLACVGTVC